MNMTIPRGANLILEFELPFIDPPESTVHLNTKGEELAFSHYGELVASLDRVNNADVLKLMHYNSKWWIRYESPVPSFLPDGVSEYEFIVVGMDDEVVMQESGTVTIDG